MKKSNCSGFTLIEILIASSLSLILVIGILRLYLSFVNSYNMQDVITEMNQNASYTCKRLSDEIMQAGAYLPDSGYTIITVNSSSNNDITIRANPFAAFQVFVIDTFTAEKMPVDNGVLFRGIKDLLKLDTNGTLSEYSINTAYNVAPFEEGVNTDSVPNEIYLTAPSSFVHGDILFASREYRYYKNGTTLCLNTDDNILAENIDSLSVTFYDTAKAVTTSWTSMRYASIYVRSRAGVADLKYTHPTVGDHYRRYVQTMDVLIRKNSTF